MDSSTSISMSISKNDLDENMTISTPPVEPPVLPEAISNETIGRGDIILDTYLVTSEAVEGGMGSVWRVRHRDWNTDLALKRPKPRFFAEGSAKKKEEFVNECRNWINLGMHPDIVSCYYVRELGGVPSIFSEWMDGGSLKDRIQDGALYVGSDRAVQERILSIAIQALQGLQYAHQKGLIHQDIKPGNLLLTANWDAKVADFGLAKARTDLEAADPTLLPAGYTPAYCPKEQAEGVAAQPWMDMYAWALTVLEMYAKERLWKTGAEAADHVKEYFDKCPVPVPTDLKGILRACIVRNPQHQEKKPADGTHTSETEEILRQMLMIYKTQTGRDYPDPAPEGGADTAGSLNNQALSYLDLGQPEEAEKLWERAVYTDNQHWDSVINRTLYQWRIGRIHDLDAMHELEQIRDPEVREEAYRQLCRERGGDKISLEYPAPVKGEVPQKEYSFIGAARIDDDTLSLVLSFLDERAVQVRRYDVESGKLVETIPQEGTDNKIGTDRPRGDLPGAEIQHISKIETDGSHVAFLSKNADRMLLFENRKIGGRLTDITELWDTRGQEKISEYSERSELLHREKNSIRSALHRHYYKKYLDNPDSDYYSAYVSDRSSGEMRVENTIRRFSDGAEVCTIGNQDYPLFIDSDTAVLCAEKAGYDKTGTYSTHCYYRNVYDLSDMTQTQTFPVMGDAPGRRGVFRSFTDSYYYWQADRAMGFQIEFWRQDGKELKPAAVKAPWQGRRSGAEADLMYYLYEHCSDVIMDQYLYIYEVSTGRVLQTLRVNPPDQFAYFTDELPYMLTDYRNRRLIFYFCSDKKEIPVRPQWFVVPMPEIDVDANAMPYRVSHPQSFREISDQEQRIRDCGEQFKRSQKEGDVPGMLAEYNSLRDIPSFDSEDTRKKLEEMNRALMCRCRPVSIRSVQEISSGPEEPYASLRALKERIVQDKKKYLQAKIFHRRGEIQVFSLNPGGSDQRAKSCRMEVYTPEGKLKDSRKYSIYKLHDHLDETVSAYSTGGWLMLKRHIPGADYFDSTRKFMLLNARTGETTIINDSFPYDLRESVISPDGKTIYGYGTGGFNKEHEDFLHIYYVGDERAETPELPSVLPPDYRATKYIRLSPDGKRLFVASEHRRYDKSDLEGAVRAEYSYSFLLWDIAAHSWKCIRHMKGSLHEIWATEDMEFICCRYTTEKERSLAAMYAIFRTKDGECVWEASNLNIYPHGFSDDNCYLVDKEEMPAASIYWEYEEDRK